MAIIMTISRGKGKSMNLNTGYVIDCTMGTTNIPNTSVQTASVLSPLQYLAYLYSFSQEDQIIVCPLNRKNYESWSITKVNEISHRSLVISIEMIGNEIILGIEPDVDARMIKVGTKLILESENKQHNLGKISKIYKFNKDIPYPRKSSTQHVSLYTIFFEEFVKKNLLEFAKSTFPIVALTSFQIFQEQKERNSQIESFEGTFYNGILVDGKVTRFNGIFGEGIFNGANCTLHNLGKLISQGICYEGIFENGVLITGSLITPNGDWFEATSASGFLTLTGTGKLTMPTGEVHQGIFVDGILRKGKIVYPKRGLAKEDFTNGGIFVGVFKNGKLKKGTKIWSNGYWRKGTFEGEGKQIDQKKVKAVGIFRGGKCIRGKMFWPINFWKKAILSGKRRRFRKEVIADGTFSEGNFIEGRMTWPNGYWREGIFEGVGQQIDQRGIIAEGTFKGGKLIRGKLFCSKPYHVWPVGYCEDGIFEEEGTQIGQNEVIAKGEFIFQKLIRGKITWPKDELWLEGTFNGEGKVTSSTGYLEKGIFVRGILIKGKKKFRSGQWEEGVFCGNGILIDDAGFIYEGSLDHGNLREGKKTFPDGYWIDGTFDGFGKRMHQNGVIEKGYFSEGAFHHGKRTLPNGYWIKGTFHGSGKQIDQKGCKWKGYFERGQLEGEGEFINSDGIMLKGFFTNGKIISGEKTKPNGERREGNFEGEGQQIVQKSFEYTEKGIFERGILVKGKVNPSDGIWTEKHENEKLFVLAGTFEIESGLCKSISYHPISDIPSSEARWCVSSKKKKIKQYVHRKSMTEGTMLSDRIEERIIDYLKETRPLELIDIREDNALVILQTSKVIDVLVKRKVIPNMRKSTYLIRQAAMRRAPVKINSAEAFTISLNPEDYNNLEYLVDPKNWINERVAKQAKLTINFHILSRSLATRVKRTVRALRGNTGAGKSLWIQTFLNQTFLKAPKEYLDDNDHLDHGVLNPDYFKAIIKKLDDQVLLNGQVHAEGTALYARFFGMLTKQPSDVTGAVVDTRLLTIEEFRKVLEFSRSRGAKLKIIDIDAPIWCSILSVLNRAPFGKDPCVAFDVIKRGYIDARANRREFIQTSMQEQLSYSLYHLTKAGEYILLARKKQSEEHLWFSSQKLFNKCLKIQSEDKLNAIAHTVITDELIQSLAVPGKKEILHEWKGRTVEDALRLHSHGKNRYC